MSASTITPSAPATASYVSHFEKLNGHAPRWLADLRGRGLARFRALGFPTTRLEEWKYTNVAPIAKTAFGRAAAGPAPSGADLRPLGIGDGPRLVFVNGRYDAGLSNRRGLPERVVVRSLAEALAEDPPFLRDHLGRVAEHEAQSFVALNTAFLEDGAVVFLPRGTTVAAPIHLLFAFVGGDEPLVCHPRVLIVAAESTEASLVESFWGTSRATYFTNAVTEIRLGADARLAHYRLQCEGDRGFHVSTIQAQQEAASRFSSHVFCFGGALARTEVGTSLDGDGSECSLDGLYFTSGEQHADHHTSIDHQRPHCTSRQLYKGVMDDRSSAVFNGKVIVRPDAQHTNAHQANDNLLLSSTATIDTKPQLEIFADDVKCSHGATVGRLDEEAMFYLRTRAIDVDAARSILLYAFANEMVERIPNQPVRARVDALLRSRFHTA